MGRQFALYFYGFLLIFVLLAGCFPNYEYDKRQHTDIDLACSQVKPNQAQAELLTKTLVEQALDVELDVGTRVYWTDTYCHYPSMIGVNNTAVVWRGRCYAGLEFHCEEIYVADRGLIGDSAFVHELGHCYRQHLGWDGDGDHSDQEFWGLMNSIDAEIDKRGW